MTRQELELAHRRARQVVASIDEQTIILTPKVFTTGSLGWHGQAKVEVDGTRCQVSVVLTVIGSKPKDTAEQTLPGDVLHRKSQAGEHKDTALGNAPEPPPETSPLFGDPRSKKPTRKRS